MKQLSMKQVILHVKFHLEERQLAWTKQITDGLRAKSSMIHSFDLEVLSEI